VGEIPGFASNTLPNNHDSSELRQPLLKAVMANDLHCRGSKEELDLFEKYLRVVKYHPYCSFHKE
jgi:hypothetical protein